MESLYLVPPLTRAKSRDHKLVRAQKKMSKGHPKALPKSHSVVTALKCSGKSYVIGPRSMLFQTISIHVGSSHIINKRLWDFKVPWSPGFCVRPPSKRWFLKIIQMNMKFVPFWCHVRIHVDFTPMLYSLAPLVSRAYYEANLDRLRLFHQWECLKCSGHGSSVLCVKWPLPSLCNLMESCLAPPNQEPTVCIHKFTYESKNGKPACNGGCTLGYKTKEVQK